MSALEIVLMVLMGVGLAIYVALSIYDLKHPEKKKARKEARRQKKEQKRAERERKHGTLDKTDEEELY